RLIAPLSDAFPVRCSCGGSGTDQAGFAVSDRHWLYRRGPDRVDRRRTSETRHHRAPFLPQPGQADGHPGLRLDLREVPSSQGLGGILGSLAKCPSLEPRHSMHGPALLPDLAVITYFMIA